MDSPNAKAYTEIYEILKNIPQKDLNKIPNEIVKMIEEKRDKNYKFKLQEDIEFEEQEILRETKVILAILYRDYWATDEERKIITEQWKKDIEKSEEEKRKIYNIDDIFKKKQIVEENNKEKALVDIKKEKTYQKIINFVKNLLNF